MSITKAPKIVQFAVGHEGLHSLLLGEDGVVYFVGTARRGEDGDQTKARRPPKPVKPKIFSRLEGQNVSYVRNPRDTMVVRMNSTNLISCNKLSHFKKT